MDYYVVVYAIGAFLTVAAIFTYEKDNADRARALILAVYWPVVVVFLLVALAAGGLAVLWWVTIGRPKPGAKTVGCADCGKPHKDFPMDTVLPDDQWQAIMGSEGGLLCANCTVTRGAKLPGTIIATMRFKFADEYPDNPDAG
jgi:hypothetical protein